MDDSFRKAALWVLIGGVVLRIAFGVVNVQSNDDHMSVIKVMAYENRIPEPNQIKEAFQPKLYHGTVAVLFQILRPQSVEVETLLAQLVGCAAGIFTLFLAYLFLMKELEVSEKVRFIAFSLLALNPVLIGINAQATNDSFVILFASLAFYFGWHFFQNQRATDFCLMLGSAVLAALSKGNGLVIFLAILAVLVIALWRPRESFPRKTAAAYGVIFVVGYLALVPTLGPYWGYYRLYGSPFVTGDDRSFVLARGDTFQPVTISMVDGLFTFRFVDMLRNPHRANRYGPPPLHQSSGWSQLYGRTHFVHFDDYPGMWVVPAGTWARSLVFDIGRLILLLALFPTAMMLSGLLRSLISAGRMLLAGRIYERRLTDWLLDFTTVGYVMFLVMLFLKYRETGWFKAIYIFPAFLPFLVFFARECDRFYTWCKEKRIVRFSTDAIFTVLLLLYVIDITVLIGQLAYWWASGFLHGTGAWNSLRVFFHGS